MPNTNRISLEQVNNFSFKGMWISYAKTGTTQKPLDSDKLIKSA